MIVDLGFPLMVVAAGAIIGKAEIVLGTDRCVGANSGVELIVEVVVIDCHLARILSMVSIL